MKIKNLNINWLILALIIGSILNFNLYGFPETSYIYTHNLYGTLIYLIAWVGILILAAKNRNRKILKRSMIFWVLMTICAVINIYSNKIFDALPFLLNLLIILIIGPFFLPFYGFKYINSIDSFRFIVIIAFSLCMSISSALLFLLRRPAET